MNEIKLGDIVVETITGFRGTVTGLTKYLSGYENCLVQPSCKENGEFVEGEWFETCQLEHCFDSEEEEV